jgi:putative NIF3 family GTP cyclohydrolase 1 type 2
MEEQGMNTEDIMQLALEMADMDSVPADSGIFRPCERVKRILLGIDMEREDLLDARAGGFDLVLAHHPLNWTTFLDVMDRHETFMVDAGVPFEEAGRAGEANRAFWEELADRRHAQAAMKELCAVAEELDLGLMNIHLPCDELGRRILQEQANELGPSEPVSALMERYASLPEIEAAREGVWLACGSEARGLGRTVVIHAAGVNGGYPVANALFENGVDTVVYIHLFSEEQRHRLREEDKGSLIVTGHYGSDSLGINPLVDVLEQRGIEVVSRNKMVRVLR